MDIVEAGQDFKEAIQLQAKKISPPIFKYRFDQNSSKRLNNEILRRVIESGEDSEDVIEMQRSLVSRSIFTNTIKRHTSNKPKTENKEKTNKLLEDKKEP